MTYFDYFTSKHIDTKSQPEHYSDFAGGAGYIQGLTEDIFRSFMEELVQSYFDDFPPILQENLKNWNVLLEENPLLNYMNQDFMVIHLFAREYMFDYSRNNRHIEPKKELHQLKDNIFVLYHNFWLIQFELLPSSFPPEESTIYNSDEQELRVSLRFIDYERETDSYVPTEDYDDIFKKFIWYYRNGSDCLCPCLRTSLPYKDCCKIQFFSNINDCFGFYEIDVTFIAKQAIFDNGAEEDPYYPKVAYIPWLIEKGANLSQIFQIIDSIPGYDDLLDLSHQTEEEIQRELVSEENRLRNLVVTHNKILTGTSIWVTKDTRETTISSAYLFDDKKRLFREVEEMSNIKSAMRLPVVGYQFLVQSYLELYPSIVFVAQMDDYLSTMEVIPSWMKKTIVDSIQFITLDEPNLAASILIPKIEPLLRHIAESKSLEITSRKMRKGDNTEFSFDYILLNKLIKQVFPDDGNLKEKALNRILTTILTSNSFDAMNLRNESAHFFEGKPFTREDYYLVLHIVFLIARSQQEILQ